MLLCNQASRLCTPVVGENRGAFRHVRLVKLFMSVVIPQYFFFLSDIPRVNLSFDKLAYTGSDSCFGWLETQGTGKHFTVEIVAKKKTKSKKKSCLHFISPFVYDFSGHRGGSRCNCLTMTKKNRTCSTLELSVFSECLNPW